MDTACIEVLCKRPVGLKKINVAVLKIDAEHGAQYLLLDLTRLLKINVIDGQGVTYFREIRNARGRIMNKIELSTKILETTFDIFFIKGVVDQTRLEKQTASAINLPSRLDPVLISCGLSSVLVHSAMVGYVVDCFVIAISSLVAKNDMWSPSASVPTDCIAGGDQHHASMHDELTDDRRAKAKGISSPEAVSSTQQGLQFSLQN